MFRNRVSREHFPLDNKPIVHGINFSSGYILNMHAIWRYVYYFCFNLLIILPSIFKFGIVEYYCGFIMLIQLLWIISLIHLVLSFCSSIGFFCFGFFLDNDISVLSILFESLYKHSSRCCRMFQRLATTSRCILVIS